MRGRVLIVVRPGGYAVELLLVGCGHQTRGGGRGHRLVGLPAPCRFLRVRHEAVRGVLGDHRRRVAGGVLVVVRSGGYTCQFLLLGRGVVLGRKTLARNLIDLLAELFGHGRGEVRVVAEGVGQLLERVEGFGRTVEYLFDSLVDVLLGRGEGRGIPGGHVGADRRLAGRSMVFRRLERRGIGRREVFADGCLAVVGVALGRVQRRRVSVLQLLAQHALALGGERLGRGECRSVARGHVLADRRFTGRGVILRRLKCRGVGCRKVLADRRLPSVGVPVRRGKRRGIPVLLLPAQHALAFGGEGFGLRERRSVACSHIFADLRFPTVGVGLGRLERRGVPALQLLAQHPLALGGERLGRGERRSVARGHIGTDYSFAGICVAFCRGERRGVSRREVPADGGVLLAELVDGLVGLFDVGVEVCFDLCNAPFEDFSVRLGIFAVELPGQPFDVAHGDFVFSLVQETVEEVRELLGRGVHAPAEPFAQQCACSDCHFRRVYLVRMI